MVRHPKKNEAMLISRPKFFSPFQALMINNTFINLANSTRYNQISWTPKIKLLQTNSTYLDHWTSFRRKTYRDLLLLELFYLLSSSTEVLNSKKVKWDPLDWHYRYKLALTEHGYRSTKSVIPSSSQTLCTQWGMKIKLYIGNRELN